MGLDTYTRGVDVCWGACTSGRHACCSVVCSSSVQLSEHWISLLGTWHAWKRTYPKLLMHCMLQSSDRIVFFFKIHDQHYVRSYCKLIQLFIIYYLIQGWRRHWTEHLEESLNRSFWWIYVSCLRIRNSDRIPWEVCALTVLWSRE